MSEVYNCLKGVGYRLLWGGGVQQVPTQGIANLVERWSCIVLGEHIVEEPNHMHYKREINSSG